MGLASLPAAVLGPISFLVGQPGAWPSPGATTSNRIRLPARRGVCRPGATEATRSGRGPLPTSAPGLPVGSPLPHLRRDWDVDTSPSCVAHLLVVVPSLVPSRLKWQHGSSQNLQRCAAAMTGTCVRNQAKSSGPGVGLFPPSLNAASRKLGGALRPNLASRSSVRT
jgi:hypothetical protein